MKIPNRRCQVSQRVYEGMGSVVGRIGVPRMVNIKVGRFYGQYEWVTRDDLEVWVATIPVVPDILGFSVVPTEVRE